jgi:hypothetical protein
MLNISKPLSASQAQTYHAKEFASPEQTYWQQKGAALGEWHGELAKRFGLVGAVSADDFARLAQGQDPLTGDQLVSHRVVHEYQSPDGKTINPVEHRAGWDGTFSAPKSVSLTALVGHDDRVRDAHREAVNFALSELESYTQARIGGNHPAETTGKLVVATLEHDTARPVDGYAVTSHSSQGLTAERVLVNMDTEIHSNLINARFAYVSISRGSHAAHIFTDNVAELGERLNHDVSKTSALSFTKEEKPKESLIQDRSLERQAEIGVQLSI